MVISPLLISTISSQLSLLLFIVSLLFFARYTIDCNYNKVTIKCFFVSILFSCLINIIFLFFYGYSDIFILTFSIAISIFLLCCSFIVFMPFLFVLRTSLSVETMSILYKSNSKVTLLDLYNKFTSIHAIQDRLTAMEQNKFISRSNECYFLTKKGLFFAIWFSRLKKCWKIWPGG